MLTKFISIASEMGYINALLYGINRMMHKFGKKECIHRYILVAQPVANKPILPERFGRSIVVHKIKRNDKQLLSALPPKNNILEYRYKQNAICLGAFKDDKVIGCIWLCLSPYNEDEVRCRFIPLPHGKAAWDFDVYINPNQRSGFAFARMWDSANAYMRSQGIEWTYSRISAFNRTSLTSHNSLGAKRLGNATFFRIGNWQLMIATLAPYVHLSTSPSSIPEIPLQIQT